MTTATQANVTKLYIATFNRAPEGAGLNYWVNSGLSLESVAQSFFDQPETTAKYAGMDNQQFVETLYQNVLGRAGEAAGIAYWKGEIDSGNISKDVAVQAIINGALGADASLLESKTTVGIHFAQYGDDAPDAFAVIKETTDESVQKVIDWIDGKIPPQYLPSTYNVLDDNRVGYDLTGTAKDDVYVVEAFKTASIKGGEGSDTLDFQDFSPKGVNVNLSTGLGPIGADSTAMKLEWIENVRGTSGNDTLVGNSDANILVSMGGVDNIDGGVGNDRILFRNIADVAASIVNGGQNTDTLEITNQTEITVGATTFANLSDVEILQVGYSDEAVASAATITMSAAGNLLGSIKEIRGTDSYDKKGVAAHDVIQSAFNLDVSTTKLSSIEELKVTADDLTITVGKDTLSSVKAVTGFATDTNTNLMGTTLALAAKSGDVFDLTAPTFTNIDRVSLDGDATTAGNQAVESTIMVNQSLINSLANTLGKDGFSPGNFSQSTLKASGIGLDTSILADGDTRFKALAFGTAKEVTIGNVNDGDNVDGVVDLTTLRTITGSENDSDLLRIKPNYVHAQNLADVSTATGQQVVTITKVERLDFEETSTVALDNANLTDVKQISGDNDQAPNASAAALNAAAFALNALRLNTLAADPITAAAQSALTAAALSFTATAFPAATTLQLTAAVNAFNAAAAATDFSIVGTETLVNAALVAAAAVAGASTTTIPADLTSQFALNLAALDATASGTAAGVTAALAAAENAVARTIIDAGLETDIGGLSLKGKAIHDIYGLGNNVSGAAGGTVTIDHATTWDSAFKSLDLDSNQTIIAADAASYDFSSIIQAEGAYVDFADPLSPYYFDKFVGSTGNDIVKGGSDSFGYQLGKGNDQFIGTGTATEVVEGGEGNDDIALGDNVTDTTNVFDLVNTGTLINSLNNSKTNDYIAEANTTAPALTIYANAAALSDGKGGYASGGAGDDVITSGKGNDVLDGGAGNDTLKGGEGNDILVARDGDDTLSGGAGDDYLAGGNGNDLLEGNAGVDFLFGGKGVDVLRGDQLKDDNPNGAIEYLARDHFIFEAGDSGSTESTVDIIKDLFTLNNAANTDLDGNGIKGGAYELERTDVIQHNWFATAPGTLYATAVPGDTTGLLTGASGASYGTFFTDLGNTATATATSLQDAADKALDRVFTDKVFGVVTAANYTSMGAQFEYGGKEYVVIDAFVAGNATLADGLLANNYNATNDLIVQISDTAVSWSVSASDVLVTRWDAATL